MPEKRTEIVKFQGLVPTSPANQQLAKANRALLGIVLALMLAVFGLGFFIVPNTPLPDLLKPKTTTEVAEPAKATASAEINTLRSQLVGIVSGAMEGKLKSLEDSIKSGAVNNSLGTVAELKNDVKTLRTYSQPPQKPATVAMVSNLQLVEEVNHLKQLIYMTLASCALMLLATVGVWVKFKKRLPYQDVKKGFLGRD